MLSTILTSLSRDVAGIFLSIYCCLDSPIQAFIVHVFSLSIDIQFDIHKLQLEMIGKSCYEDKEYINIIIILFY